jgi:hypothetical protein
MDRQTFDRLARLVSSRVSRRTTLKLGGAVGLASLTGSLAVSAKNGKKPNKKKKKNQPVPLECPPPPLDRCPAEAQECTTIFTARCAGDPACLARVPCCSFLQTCDSAGFFTCIL